LVTSHQVIGKAIPRIDGADKVTSQAAWSLRSAARRAYFQTPEDAPMSPSQLISSSGVEELS
jgi:hypothetical protein